MEIKTTRNNKNESGRMRCVHIWIACLFSLVSVSMPVCAAGPVTPIASKLYEQKNSYERRHSYTLGQGTFYKDPNIWVLTPEFAQRAGMPKEWANTELQGAEAVAFRYEQDGAEQECGWMGDPNRCAPIFQCVLEIYFDNTKHKLPWDTERVSWYNKTHSSIRHLGSMPWPLPEGKDAKQAEIVRRRKLYSPFSDPVGDKELRFNNLWAKAYDRDLYAGLSMVKLDLGGCHGLYRIMPKPGEGHVLELKESCDLSCDQNKVSKRVYHRVILPHEWRVRVATALKVDAERWKKMTNEAVEKVFEENKK